MRCINCMRELKDGGGVCPYCGFDADKYKPPNDALPPGSVLNGGKYVVGRVLGRGGFGITYVALDQHLGLRVAIKECMPQRDARRDADGVSAQWLVPVYEQERARESFLREAEKLAKIYGIPGVVPVREYFDDNETTYIVMDYVEGETLAQRLRHTGPMSASECFRLLSPVMDTLAQAHRLQIEGEDEIGVIHRDIKPNNIMIGRIKGGKERVWLLDLGAAKDLGTRDSAPNVSVESRPVGTPGYAPPEQGTFKGSIGPWTDVYAMSATFIYCMTGQKPPDSQSRSSETREPEVLLSVPGSLGDVLRKGMALHREERYQTMEELRDALEKAIPKPKPKRPKWIPALVALLAIAIVAVCLIVRPQPEPVPVAEPDIPPEEQPVDTEEADEEEAPDEPEGPEPVGGGSCGLNVFWSLYYGSDPAEYELLIEVVDNGPDENYGAMHDYEDENPDMPWYEYREQIVRVRITSDVTHIGANAFAGCTRLESVELPEGQLTSIGRYAFYNCSNLKSVTIPGSVTEIGKGAFLKCGNLKNVKIPNSVTTIGEYAFQECTTLESVTIPGSVTEIGEGAFSLCSNLTDVTIVNGVTTIGKGAFWQCGNLKSVKIPNSVTTIGEAAFQECASLESIIIPNGVTTIGENAFRQCKNLDYMSFPDSVKTIGNCAFYECTALKSVTLSDNLITIGDYAFAHCIHLKSVSIPESVLEIGEYAFNDCTELVSVSIASSAVKIKEGAFTACPSLERLSAPDEVWKALPNNIFDDGVAFE
ncbi:MAG: leucine-rich repeat protein [Oscillibacter sp.]|nr:leucine-rich repeat protein [Oscillibacter sp.]